MHKLLLKLYCMYGSSSFESQSEPAPCTQANCLRLKDDRFWPYLLMESETDGWLYVIVCQHYVSPPCRISTSRKCIGYEEIREPVSLHDKNLNLRVYDIPALLKVLGKTELLTQIEKQFVLEQI